MSIHEYGYSDFLQLNFKNTILEARDVTSDRNDAKKIQAKRQTEKLRTTFLVVIMKRSLWVQAMIINNILLRCKMLSILTFPQEVLLTLPHNTGFVWHER